MLRHATCYSTVDVEIGQLENKMPTGHLDRSEAVCSIFRTEYRAYQYRFVEFFVEHLSDISRSFRGDLQAMILIAVVGQMHMQALRTAQETGLDPASVPDERKSIGASRLADITGIPRETVRRKLAQLEGKGWIKRNVDGSWKLAVTGGVAAARNDLSELDNRALERVARLYCDLDAIVSNGAQNGQVPPSED